MLGQYGFHRTRRQCLVYGLATFLILMSMRGVTPTLAEEKPSGELHIALAFLGGQRFIPWAEFVSGGIKQYMMLIHDYLVGCTDDGQLDPTGGIAQKWEQAPDKLSWTFWLRQGVTFHDGTEVTAADVKFSLESLFTPQATAGLLGPVRTAFKSLEVVDPYTVTIHQRRCDRRAGFSDRRRGRHREGRRAHRTPKRARSPHLARRPRADGSWASRPAKTRALGDVRSRSRTCSFLPDLHGVRRRTMPIFQG
jgi:hypothetical protein